MRRADDDKEYKYELFLIAFVLIACAIIILYNCFMQETPTVTRLVVSSSAQSSSAEISDDFQESLVQK